MLSKLQIDFAAASQEDREELVSIRIEAMRESLECIGRFDPVRARERFVATFEPGSTQFVEVNGQRVGLVVIKPRGSELLLEHLYIRPGFQGLGIGSTTLARLLKDADARQLPVRVGVLRESPANRFYIRHGFQRVDESEWDIYYVRNPHSPREPSVSK